MSEHIKIAARSPRKRYRADGVQRVFGFDFAVFRPEDVEIGIYHADQVFRAEVDVSIDKHEMGGLRVEEKARQGVARPGNQGFVVQ